MGAMVYPPMLATQMGPVALAPEAQHPQPLEALGKT